jgi:hypothetical protein
VATPRISPEPDHEPIGFSDEVFPRSRRWLGLLALIVPVAAAGIVAALVLEAS